MKKIVSTVLFALIILSSFVSYAMDGVNVFVNSDLVNVRGKIIDNRTLIPMRAFLEKAGFSVDWIDAEKRVKAKKEGYDIDLKIGESTMKINGNEIALSTPGVIIDGSTYVPVRAIGENTGFNVDWYAPSKTAHLSNGGDKYKYYEGANSLIPSLSSVVMTEVPTLTREGEKRSDMGYVYKNVSEDSAHNYGDILCSQFGYEYDSMELDNDYGKHYIYILGDVMTDIEIKTVDEVSYVTVYPDINPDNYTVNTEHIAENDEKHNPLGELEYYDNTTIPKFTYISGIVVSTIDRTEDGDPIYIYHGPYSEAIRYINYLQDIGFTLSKESYMDYDGRYNYLLIRNDEGIVVNAAFMSNMIWVVPYK